MPKKLGWHIETVRAAKKFVASIEADKGLDGLPKKGKYRRLVMEHLSLTSIDDIPDEYEAAYWSEWLKRHKEHLKEFGIQTI